MTKHIELKAANQGTALATGTLALPPLVIEGLEEFKGSFDRLCLQAGTAATCRGPLWVLVVSKELAKDIGGDSRERRVSQAAIAAISGLMPTMFMTRVRL